MTLSESEFTKFKDFQDDVKQKRRDVLFTLSEVDVHTSQIPYIPRSSVIPSEACLPSQRHGESRNCQCFGAAQQQSEFTKFKDFQDDAKQKEYTLTEHGDYKVEIKQ